MIIVAGCAIVACSLRGVTRLTIGLGDGRKLLNGFLHIQPVATRATIVRDDMQMPGMIEIGERHLGAASFTHRPVNILLRLV